MQAGQRIQRLAQRVASTALVAAGHFRNVNQTIPLRVGGKKHPLAGFRGSRRNKRGKLTRRKRGMKSTKGAKRRYNNTRVRNTPRKIALQADIPLTHDIETDLTQAIIGGATAAQQVWNEVPQTVLANGRIGDRIRRTGLWIQTTFTRGLAQGSTEFNQLVRVIFAKQKGHGAFPTSAAASSVAFPAWPKFNECFTRNWHRNYTLVKDMKVSFRLRQGTAPDAIARVEKVFKFSFNQKCSFDAGSEVMDVGRFYMYVTCPDAPPSTAADLRMVINQYCNYFVDELG